MKMREYMPERRWLIANNVDFKEFSVELEY